MSDDAVIVSGDDVTVRKTVDTEQFQTVAVVLELTSDRTDVARLQVVDSVPEGVPMDDIGFHLDYGAEHWSVEDGTVVFERDLEPDEEYTTIYGIRDYPEDELDALRTEPEVGIIDAGPGNLDSVVDEERSDVIRDFLSGETELAGLEETVGDVEDLPTDSEPAPPEPGPAEATDPEPAMGQEPEPDTEAEADEPEEPAAEPTPEPVEAPEGAEESGAASAEDMDDEADVSVPLSGGVVRVLIKELREGDVDPEHRRILRDELLDTDGTLEARVAHLQQRISDMEAYTNALEQFIADEGGGRDVLQDIRSDIEQLEAELAPLPDRLDQAFERLESVDDRLASVAADAETALDRADGMDDRVAGVEDEVDRVDQRIHDLREELDSQQTALEEEIESLEADLQELHEFQQRLKSVFGNDGGPGGPT
ncbi:MAG: ATP-binding protein [Halobacteriales archaeon]